MPGQRMGERSGGAELMRKRMGKAAVSLVLAAAMAVWTPPAGGASLAASGGTASEGNLGGRVF